MTEDPTPDGDGDGEFAPLRLTATIVGDGIVVIAVSGELDMATAPQVTTFMRQATTSGTHTIALDLSAVTFLGSSGIQMLVAALADDRGVHGRLHLIAPSAPVLRVLRIVGMHEVFTTHATLEEMSGSTTGDGPPSR